MKRKSDIFIILLLVVGFFVLAYPTISNYLASRNHSKVIQEYQGTIDTYSDEEIIRQFENAEAYNHSLSGLRISDPFTQSSRATIDASYTSILNSKDVMGYIEIPSIDVHLPIYHSVSEAVLEKGVGHMEGTAFPVGGHGNHSVLSGHRGLPTSKIFTDLDRLEIGDEFVIHVLDRTLVYEIDQIAVVEPNDTNLLEPIVDQEYVTLVTCDPYAVNSHRLLLRGTRVTTTIDEIQTEHKESKPTLVYGMFVVVIIGCILCIPRRKRANKT